MANSEPVIYSVWIRRGPDIEKYDLIFTEHGIVLRLLGEYWSTLRPRTGLQKRADLLLYTIRKKRTRQGDTSSVNIDYCEIASYELRRIRRLQQTRVGKSMTEKARLLLILRDGRRLEIEFSTSVYDIAKRLVKEYLVKGVNRCRKTNKER